MEDLCSVKLTKMVEPQPSTHPDWRMRLTITDVKRLFPTRKYTTTRLVLGNQS